MAHTLEYDSTSVSLKLQWSDEFNWRPVQQSVEYLSDGNLLVQYGARQAGRPITLAPAADDMGWTPRSTVDQLYTWAETGGLILTLTLSDAREFDVMFREPMTARPVTGFQTYEDDEPWLVTVPLIEVPQS
jgi:hypothetical protein